MYTPQSGFLGIPIKQTITNLLKDVNNACFLSCLKDWEIDLDLKELQFYSSFRLESGQCVHASESWFGKQRYDCVLFEWKDEQNNQFQICAELQQLIEINNHGYAYVQLYNIIDFQDLFNSNGWIHLKKEWMSRKTIKNSR